MLTMCPGLMAVCVSLCQHLPGWPVTNIWWGIKLEIIYILSLFFQIYFSFQCSIFCVRFLNKISFFFSLQSMVIFGKNRLYNVDIHFKLSICVFFYIIWGLKNLYPGFQRIFHIFFPVINIVLRLSHTYYLKTLKT